MPQFLLGNPISTICILNHNAEECGSRFEFLAHCCCVSSMPQHAAPVEFGALQVGVSEAGRSTQFSTSRGVAAHGLTLTIRRKENVHRKVYARVKFAWVLFDTNLNSSVGNFTVLPAETLS